MTSQVARDGRIQGESGLAELNDLLSQEWRVTQVCAMGGGDSNMHICRSLPVWSLWNEIILTPRQSSRYSSTGTLTLDFSECQSDGYYGRL